MEPFKNERQKAPYGSKCVEDWSQSNYSDYLALPWEYTAKVSRREIAT